MSRGTGGGGEGKRVGGGGVGSRRIGPRSVTRFTILETLGEGTFGEVLLARDNESDEVVALKQMKMIKYKPMIDKFGFPRQILSELRSLQEMHLMGVKSVVTLQEVAMGAHLGGKDSARGTSGELYLVMDFVPNKLTSVIKHAPELSRAHLRSYMRQILWGLANMHASRILHRDLKPDNILMTQENEIFLADFGCARHVKHGSDGKQHGWAPGLQTRDLTTGAHIFTQHYRAPEVIFGSTDYGPPADVWSAGIIFLDMIVGDYVCRVKDKDINAQVAWIYDNIGLPTLEDWPQLTSLRYYQDLKPIGAVLERNKGKATLEGFIAKHPGRWSTYREELELVAQMLQLNPARRISAFDAYNHDIFSPATGMSFDPRDLPPVKLRDGHKAGAMRKSSVGRGGRGGIDLRGRSQSRERPDASHLDETLSQRSRESGVSRGGGSTVRSGAAGGGGRRSVGGRGSIGKGGKGGKGKGGSGGRTSKTAADLMQGMVMDDRGGAGKRGQKKKLGKKRGRSMSKERATQSEPRLSSPLKRPLPSPAATVGKLTTTTTTTTPPPPPPPLPHPSSSSFASSASFPQAPAPRPAGTGTMQPASKRRKRAVLDSADSAASIAAPSLPSVSPPKTTESKEETKE